MLVTPTGSVLQAQKNQAVPAEKKYLPQLPRDLHLCEAVESHRNGTAPTCGFVSSELLADW